ncbi:spore germination lipoprotein GerD [Sporosarcina sp. G11-34]|uniref:spore germination lipoprotein GerD n=1 Tax=Sporosarcina sp. G11-34 TaxID=2849605 RepID=UPI0022A8FF41|nr:spore germination lipoprotein GerD [Sporosarcina sp. G11-34]
MKNKLIQLVVIVFLLVGCSAQQTQPSYDEMKKMMTDALQTEDGKKALRQTLADPEFRELIVLEHPEVKKSIEETLLSEKGEKFWKKTFEDPKFTETIAKSMKGQQQDVMKELMNDASFQKEMEEFFGQPDMQKQLETVMQSANMKEHLEKVVEETINSPLLQIKWQELIMAADKASEKDSSSGGKKEEKKPEENKNGGGK